MQLERLETLAEYPFASVRSPNFLRIRKLINGL